jgi:hypothetical protein
MAVCVRASAGRRDATPDPATRHHHQSGGATNEPAGDTCRNAKLKHGKPSRFGMHAKADDQPDDSADQSPRDHTPGCAPFKKLLAV